MRVGEIEYANSYISSTDQKLTYTTQTKKEWKMKKKSKQNANQFGMNPSSHSKQHTFCGTCSQTLIIYAVCRDFIIFFIILFLQPNAVGLQWT